MGFGSNQAMLRNDAQQASVILTEVLSGEQQVQQKQQFMNIVAVSLLLAAVLVKVASK